MPNWCMNNLTISHADLAKVQEFADAYNSGETCQRFIPRPESVNNKDAFAEDGWYTWNVNHWGTKWDFGKDKLDDPLVVQDGLASISFDTAWSPPIQLYDRLVELGYDVDATYFEPGMGFCGVYYNGDDDYVDYGDDKNEIPDRIWDDYALDDFFEMMEEET
jgi:hypothetical protein